MKISNSFVNATNIINGNHNKVTVLSNPKAIDWEQLTKEINQHLNVLPQDSREHTACLDLYFVASKRDEKLFKNKLKKYASLLTTNILSGTTSGILVKMLSDYM
ncbi:hypothetical protein [Listeria ilorinensis]|uniref:hypothetical protein n=1 Tax=Listeria ilorinensis TaxID=2867439 RepID=UPI001EF545EC|nr:hypothetical protein [Listeria ilorinensis]